MSFFEINGLNVKENCPCQIVQRQCRGGGIVRRRAGEEEGPSHAGAGERYVES